VFAVNPVIEIGLDAPVPVNPPGDEVAVNVEIAAPPVAPVVNATVAVVVPVAVAAPIVGACGTVVAVMLEDAAEVNVPLALAAETAKV
jgi:hypothetical protein